VGDRAQGPLEHKLALAPLFLPGVTRAKLQQAVQHHALLVYVDVGVE
jgi:hypothetical protein